LKEDLMKIRTPLLLAITVTALVSATAAPAFAASSPTTTTFALTGGALTLGTQQTAALTGTTAGQTSITGSLGLVTVTDARAGVDAWTVSAASTAFTGALTDPSSSTGVTYTGGTVATTGTITVADGGAIPLTTTPSTVLAPSALSGTNTATWTPTLDVAMPAGAKADTYSGTVTTSVV
jgi:hypothetical protein